MAKEHEGGFDFSYQLKHLKGVLSVVMTNGMNHSRPSVKGAKPFGLTKKRRRNILVKDLVRNKYIYLMLLPVVLYYLIFCYGPMYGAQIAFRDFSPGRGIWSSPWVGFKYFQEFFQSYYFVRLLRNTLLLNIFDIVFGFPMPIIMAILINEVRHRVFKRTIQTIFYLPHFISIVVICGIILDFTSGNGVINSLLGLMGFAKIRFLLLPEWFRTIYVGSDIWQATGWNSIIYLAALANISPDLYEAAKVDGAGRFRQMLNITLPGLAPTIIIMLILRMGRIMYVGVEKIILLYNPSTYETADVISSFVYRKGVIEMNYSYTTAIGLFNSAISFALVYSVNRLSRKVSDSSLW